MFTRRKSRQAAYPLLCALLINGCASRPESLTADARQHLGKVYLSSTGTTGETFFHADFANGGTGGAIKGAGKGALSGLDSCLNGALSTGGLAPIVLLVCTPIMLPTAMIKGSKAGSTPAIAPDTLANLDQQTNAVLKSADLSPALVATLDEQSQQNDYLAQYEISHGTLPLPEKNESINDVAAKWDYQTVMEVQVTKAGLQSDDSKVPMMHFAMTAHTKLIEAKSGAVLQEQDYDYSGSPHPFSFWFDDDYKSLAQEIVQANKTTANNILDKTFIK